MQILLKEHRRFITKLIEGKVEFILIGGYAVIYHGYPRTTDDLDIWIRPDEINKERLLQVLAGEGIVEEDLKQLKALDFSIPQMFHIGEPPERIDFLTQTAGLNFPEAQRIQVYFQINDCLVPVLNVEHLIMAKLLTNRTKDKADVEELQKVLRLKK